MVPGIAGIIRRDMDGSEEEDLGVMVNSMMHEPFYSSGIYRNHELGAYIGWVSHAGSFCDCMPVINERQDLVLVFAGEDFLDKDEIKELKRLGHRFDTMNSSYLVHLFEENNEGFFGRLNGWFCGAIFDLRKSKVTIFNDRYGMKRLYYYETEREFLFASEAKALLKVRPELRELDPRGIGELISCGCVLENRTLFPKVSVLPGGSALVFHNGKLSSKGRYFEPGYWEDQEILGEEEFYQKLRSTFLKVLPKYFNSGQPVALSLTGGLDTRMILACGEFSPGTLPCYTFGGMYRDSFDVSIGRKVAEACRQPHKTIILDERFLREFPDHAEKTVYISDGCFNACGAYELYLNRKAKEIAPVRVTGNYGSEVLRGVRAFKAIAPFTNVFSDGLNTYLEMAKETFADVSRDHPVSFAVYKLGPWYGHGRMTVEESQIIPRTPYMDCDFVRVAYQAPRDLLVSEEISLRLVKDCSLVLAEIKTDQGVGVEGNGIAANLTRLLYRATFKAEYYYGIGMPHWLAKMDSALSFIELERAVLGRHKFHHFRVWFRDQLSKYVQEIVLDQQTRNRSHVNGKFLEEMVTDHIKGRRNFTDEIDKVITLELIQRLLVESS